MENIAEEIELFLQIEKTLSDPDLTVESTAPYCFEVFAKGQTPSADKPCDLMVMAVTHGNEVGGIRVLNEWMKHLNASLLGDLRLGLNLGNPHASLKNVRFVERDLNRSFGREAKGDLEEKRAAELAPILQRAAFFLDLHQTIEPAEKPFFIFPYNPHSFGFATSIDSHIPIVTHWGKGFSKEGRCTDEFVNLSGGVGITLELGQNGFSPFKVGAGFKACSDALRFVKNFKKTHRYQEPAKDLEIYTWGEVVAWPDGEASLDEGWYNFKEVKAGERLGVVDGQALFAQASGPVLFPKYPKPIGKKLPTEMIRILKRVSIEQLGQPLDHF